LLLVLVIVKEVTFCVDAAARSNNEYLQAELMVIFVVSKMRRRVMYSGQYGVKE